MSQQRSIPVIDVSPLVHRADKVQATAAAIHDACAQHGFFYVRGHGVEQRLQDRLEELSRKFFAQDVSTKMAIGMQHGGRAWRGYFPVGNELTSGKPDQKEGIYFGAELPDDHPKVTGSVPLHGPNLFPDIPGFRDAVLAYLAAMTSLGHALMEGMALSLNLEQSYFRARLTRDPTILFRIFHYPPLARHDGRWSVGEHSDYGMLTILKQSDDSGLQIKSQGEWIDAPPIPGTFVCNLGDMLDRMTGGRYRSTPHRVLNTGGRSRLSFPFFFDPSWDAEVEPVFPEKADDRSERWDNTSLRELRGTYGEYLLRKVAKVFPELSRKQL